MMTEDLSKLDRTTLVVWRGLNAWSWGLGAFVAAVALHLGFNALLMVIPSGDAYTPALAWQFAIRAVTALTVGVTIGWIAWRGIGASAWRTALVTAGLYAFAAVTVLDRLFHLPEVAEVTRVFEDGGGTVMVGSGPAGPLFVAAFTALTAAAALVAGAYAWRRQKS